MPRLPKLVETHERRKHMLWIVLLALLVGSMLMVAVPIATGSPTLQLWALFLAILLVFLVLTFLALWLVGHRVLEFVAPPRRRRRRSRAAPVTLGRLELRTERTGEKRGKERSRFSRLKEE